MRGPPVALAVLLLAAAALAGVATPTGAPGAGPEPASGPAGATALAPDRTAGAAGVTEATGATRATGSTGATDAVQTGGTAAGDRNTTGVLAIPEDAVARSTVHRHRVDLGPAVGVAGDAADARLAALTAFERVAAANGSDERKQQLLGEVNRIEQRAIGLESRQEAAIAAYEAGEISPRTFAIRMALIDVEARALQDRREGLAERAAATPDFELDPGRMASLERELATFTGPVRGHAADALTGRAPATRLYVETGGAGVTMAAIVDGAYVRETYRGERRDRGGGSIDPETALNVTADAYPAVWETRLRGEETTSVTGSGNLYLVRVPHERGELLATVDGGSRLVFRDVHRQPLATAPSDETVANTRDGLELTLNRTYAGGPLRIELTDAETGEPVDANVTIGDGSGESELLGRTGADGVIWTLSPRGEFTVTTIRGNAAVFVTVTAAPPPGIRDGDGDDADGNGTAG